MGSEMCIRDRYCAIFFTRSMHSRFPGTRSRVSPHRLTWTTQPLCHCARVYHNIRNNCVNHMFVYLCHDAAEHLMTFVALSRFYVLSPRLFYASGSREKGEGAKKGGFSRLANLSRFCMQRSIRDIRLLHTCGTRGRIQGRTLGSLGWCLYLWGLFTQTHITVYFPCSRSRAQRIG